MIQLNELLIAELKRESDSTRKLLQCVPDNNNEWRPHEKSFPIARMAAHVAEIPHWINRILSSEFFDFAANSYPTNTFDTNKELMAFFEERLKAAIAALEQTNNDELMKEWQLRRGDFVISKSTKYDSIRHWMSNHQVHHRGQLSVYLRLLDVAIPGMYGPSADDLIARKKAAEAAAAQNG